MVPRLRGAAVSLLCLLSFGPLGVHAAYTCTALGTECADRDYTSGSFSTEAAARTACDNDPDCVAYDFSPSQSLGFLCSCLLYTSPSPRDRG